jgi:nucleotide-binding universal stress UspA family protein
MQTRGPGGNMIRFKKILCPVDFFETSTRAFNYAFKLAEHYDAKIHAIHVVAPIVGPAYGAPISVEDMTQDLKKESERFLKDLRNRVSNGATLKRESRLACPMR